MTSHHHYNNLTYDVINSSQEYWVLSYDVIIITITT